MPVTILRGNAIALPLADNSVDLIVTSPPYFSLRSYTDGDPFGGTGTTALVAAVLGRHGITVDMSADYCRLAAWRTGDEQQRAKVARRAGLVGSRPKRRRRIVDSAARGFEQGVLDIGGAS